MSEEAVRAYKRNSQSTGLPQLFKAHQILRLRLEKKWDCALRGISQSFLIEKCLSAQIPHVSSCLSPENDHP